MRKFFAALLIAAMLLTLSAPAFAEMVVQTGKVGARLRSEPCVADDNTIAKIHQYEFLTVLDQTGEWYRVSFGNMTGYVHSGNLTIVSEDDNSGTSGNPFDNYQEETANPFDNYNEDAGNPVNANEYKLRNGVSIKEYYEQYGGQAVEAFAYGGRIGCKMRNWMDFTDDENIVTSIHKDEPMYLYCSFYHHGDMWYYAVTRDGYEGFVHSGNVVFNKGW